MDNFRRKKRLLGVTLPEMLVVFSIIVILALVAFWFLRNQILKGNDAKRKGDIHRIQVAVEEYEKDNDCYPSIEVMVCNPGGGLKPYFSKIPCDPVTNDSYFYEVDDPSCASWYRIYANLGNEADPVIGELGCTYGCGPETAYNYYVTSPNAPNPEKGESGLYGCFSGVCTPIDFYPGRDPPGGVCDPSYYCPGCPDPCFSSNYPGNSFCGTLDDPQNECQPWSP
jgi:type II secretory pathway pseudopilin PulG